MIDRRPEEAVGRNPGSADKVLQSILGIALAEAITFCGLFLAWRIMDSEVSGMAWPFFLIIQTKQQPNEWISSRQFSQLKQPMMKIPCKFLTRQQNRKLLGICDC